MLPASLISGMLDPVERRMMVLRRESMKSVVPMRRSGEIGSAYERRARFSRDASLFSIGGEAGV
jgi:hypothetical protein